MASDSSECGSHNENGWRSLLRRLSRGGLARIKLQHHVDRPNDLTRLHIVMHMRLSFASIFITNLAIKRTIRSLGLSKKISKVYLKSHPISTRLLLELAKIRRISRRMSLIDKSAYYVRSIRHLSSTVFCLSYLFSNHLILSEKWLNVQAKEMIDNATNFCQLPIKLRGKILEKKLIYNLTIILT